MGMNDENKYIFLCKRAVSDVLEDLPQSSIQGVDPKTPNFTRHNYEKTILPWH